MGRLSGLLREITGALTGDRRTEARGRAEERAAAERQAGPDGDVTREAVEEHLQDMREEHGDIPRREDGDVPPA